jgi:hypothetical protein
VVVSQAASVSCGTLRAGLVTARSWAVWRLIQKSGVVPKTPDNRDLVASFAGRAPVLERDPFDRLGVCVG